MNFALRYSITKSGLLLGAYSLLDEDRRKFGRPLRIKSIWPDITSGFLPRVPSGVLHTTCGCMGGLEYSASDVQDLVEQVQKQMTITQPRLNAYLIVGSAADSDWLSPEERRRLDLDDGYVALRVLLFSVETGRGYE